jgi:hypothetical protein
MTSYSDLLEWVEAENESKSEDSPFVFRVTQWRCSGCFIVDRYKKVRFSTMSRELFRRAMELCKNLDVSDITGEEIPKGSRLAKNLTSMWRMWDCERAHGEAHDLVLKSGGDHYSYNLFSDDNAVDMGCPTWQIEFDGYTDVLPDCTCD